MSTFACVMCVYGCGKQKFLLCLSLKDNLVLCMNSLGGGLGLVGEEPMQYLPTLPEPLDEAIEET